MTKCVFFFLHIHFSLNTFCRRTNNDQKWMGRRKKKERPSCSAAATTSSCNTTFYAFIFIIIIIYFSIFVCCVLHFQPRSQRTAEWWIKMHEFVLCALTHIQIPGPDVHIKSWWFFKFCLSYSYAAAGCFGLKKKSAQGFWLVSKEFFECYV